ncbi:MAG: ABC transporter ATP-binding protein, partial [Actinomycetota bacterium]
EHDRTALHPNGDAAAHVDRGHVVTAVRLVDVERVYHSHGGDVRALDGVTAELEPGSITVLYGPSGSGKTTLLNLVAALDRATSGSVKVLGADLGALGDDAATRWRRANVASIFQAKGLVGHLTAAENVDLALRLVGASGRGDGRGAEQQRARRARREARRRHGTATLESVGLGDHLDHRPAQLSGGQQQRVAIARALAVEAPLLVADEPTGELDSDTSAAMIELIVDDVVRRGATALISTHDVAFRDAADRTLELVDGRLS